MSSTRRDFFGAFTGRLSAVPRARPRQRSRTGQRRHFGGPFGTQTVAPSSMRDWLKIRVSALASGKIFWTWERMAFFV